MDCKTQDNDMISKQTEDIVYEKEDELFETVCAICDNGGHLICCEGKCFRSFHATPDTEEAQDSVCETACLTSEELEKPYECENCKYSLHQCFVCAELGSSDESSKTEVFRCSATCRHFYHPRCVAKLLSKKDKAKQRALKEKIAAGEPFTCPAHKCVVCKKPENVKVEGMQFAICRRCPKAYHMKCLPSNIMFDHLAGDDDEIRGWIGLFIKSRALIYCLEHKMDPELGTPARPIIVRNILNRKKERLMEAHFKNLFI
ncbi:hypothetical protein SSX86_008689 [Deinandra increscens subsp. villosa]|uniref:Zinc finger PHD-type domain-containing protein n=1 Tax=Deinandra increscens subsp. villosa TaxID=3103831 RepID=A0AAP0H4W2_9ASTR